MLTDWTPKAWKNANPVVVVDGSEVMLDVVLGDIPLQGGILHMKIQKRGECPDFDDHGSSAIPANPIGWQRVTPCSTGECPDFDDHCSSATPANVMTVVVHQEDGYSKQVLMSRTTTFETVLKVLTPAAAALMNANPVVVVEGREAFPLLTVGMCSTNGNLVHLEIRQGMQL